MVKALVVEDDLKTADYLRQGLSEEGLVVDVAHDGEKAVSILQAGEFDVVILDLMLPRLDGWAVLSAMRDSGNHTPVLVLTARDAVLDRVRGFELGADDYLVKPFAFSELIARIRAILRRSASRQPERLAIGDLEIDCSSRRVMRGGKRLELTPKEFSLLLLLARRSGEVLSRTLIAEQVWEMNFQSGTNFVEVHIRRLRSKIDDAFRDKLIHTVRGAGYVLECRD
jgi:two-component system copper resistance phosphate regulon response regulator CusR